MVDKQWANKHMENLLGVIFFISPETFRFGPTSVE